MPFQNLSPIKKIIPLYIALAFSILAGCIPHMMAQNIGAFGSLLVLISAYIMESKHHKESLEAHHCIYIIRTIWIWSAFLIISLIGAGIDVSDKADMSAIDDLTANILNGMIPTEMQMQAAVNKCLDTNLELILRTTVIWVAPAQLYGTWRCIRGFARARHGFRLANPRSWL